MPLTNALKFIKMNGLGNDFIIFDARQGPVPLNASSISALANRHHGIGCDQLIVLENSEAGADLFMRIFNADGSEAEACGNAARCVAWLCFQETQKTTCTIETIVGILGAAATQDPWQTTVDMGAPALRWDQIPLAEEFADTTGIELQIGPIDDPVLHTPSVVNMGNPHAIFWVDDLKTHDLSKHGPLLEYHPLFPERANISIAQVLSDDHIEAKVWERGVGLTQACGSGACAILVAAARLGYTKREARVTLPGGDLFISWDESSDHVLMTAPVALEGVFDVPPALDPRRETALA